MAARAAVYTHRPSKPKVPDDPMKLAEYVTGPLRTYVSGCGYDRVLDLTHPREVGWDDDHADRQE